MIGNGLALLGLMVGVLVGLGLWIPGAVLGVLVAAYVVARIYRLELP